MRLAMRTARIDRVGDPQTQRASSHWAIPAAVPASWRQRRVLLPSLHLTTPSALDLGTQKLLLDMVVPDCSNMFGFEYPECIVHEFLAFSRCYNLGTTQRKKGSERLRIPSETRQYIYRSGDYESKRDVEFMTME
jgi:hypothetical protein